MSYLRLSQMRMDNAPQLDLTTYGLAGYESVARYFAEFPIGAAEAIFSWQAMAGAAYTLQSSSYVDPGVLLVYDAAGNAIGEDDGAGISGSDHLTFIAPYSGTFYVSPGWRQGSGEGQQGVTLSVYEDLGPMDGQVFSGGPQNDFLTGTSGAENLYGGAGDDRLHGLDGDDYLDGGVGHDLAFYGKARANYEVRAFGDRFLVTDLAGNEGRDMLANMERLVFPDMSVAVDVDGAGGKAFRLYQAALNRSPDIQGLGFWIYALDHGTSLESVANGFIGSAEFRSIYGDTPSNADLVYRFYLNVLHREPDASGLEFWVRALDLNIATRAQVLLGFSESPENYLQLIGSMDNGFQFIPWA